jgi:hypothetical protein
VRRRERKPVTVFQEQVVEYKCDRCGVSEEDSEGGWLFPVAIEVNMDEEFGSRDEYDYCNPCLIALADVLVAAGSRSELVTGGTEP